MRYIDTGGEVVPKHCKFGPRPAEGIVFNSVEWWSITDHLVKEQREREYAAVQRAKEEAKKEISYNMTRNWSNTMASIKTQANQKRTEKMEKEKQDKVDQYEEIMRNRKEEKKKILEDVRRVIYENQDFSRAINSAVGLSLVHEECRKQIEMRNSIQKEKERKETESAMKIKKEAEEFAKENPKEKEREKRALQKKYLDEQVADQKRRKKAEEAELAKQKQDLINMRIEEEKIHHCNMVEKNYRKEFAERYMRKTEAQLEFERKLVLEQEEEDEINKIFMEYDRRFKKERKVREERIRNEAVEKRSKIAEKLGEKLKEAARKEEERLKAAEEEKEKDAMRQEASKKELQDLALKSLLEGKRKSEQRKARRQYERKEEKKWELMQQYRSAEINEEWRAAERERKKEIVRQTRAGLDCQVKQQKEREARDLEEWLKPLEDENRFKEDMLKYSEEAMDFIRENNLPTYPVLLTVAKLKKHYDWRDDKESQQGQDQSGQAGGRKGNPRSSINGCFCFKY